ncbi:Alpha/Beta hydrolase protein [Pseudomassariella vexata]|uniref:Alpha/Beta hydrolase protein n=1 Tax=Pseudomassariella vexata TaxID=1141098 RepID=A0A1Y2EKH2_9PEZI|nr:Alpha/Beta hydrolase protein [Pseudomassariella vexata]ORY72041.1 Alpha/Beta hydrolase protein [Pseudomassariella vexata]
MNPLSCAAAARLSLLRRAAPQRLPQRQTACPYSSSSSRVPLAFEHHKPPKDGRHHQDAPIIFMHGLFGSKKNNRSVSKVLARDLKRHVYTLDLRNHGDSPHAPKHDYLAMSGDVAGFIEQHGLKSTTLIGHSMGAKTAMTLALTEPSLIANLVSVDNAPVDAALGTDFAKYVHGMRKIDESDVTKQTEADKILQEYESEIGIRQFLLGNLHRPDGGKVLKYKVPLDILAKTLNGLGDFPFKDPGQVRFEKPALFVRGTHSKYVPDEVIPLIGQFFPRFSMVDIDAGHWVISEKPQLFLEAVIDFLSPKE